MTTDSTENFTIMYSNEAYSLRLILFRLANKNLKVVDEKDIIFSEYITQRMFREIEITSDIRYPILLGSITVKDYGRDFISKNIILDGYTFLTIEITKLEEKKQYNFKQVFIVKDFNIMDVANGIIKYDLISIDWFKFNNYFNYSNQSSTPFTKIVRDLLTQSELKNELIGIEGNNNGKFITPNNWKLLNSIEYTLANCYHEDTGIYILRNNPMKNSYDLIQLKTYINKLIDETEAIKRVDENNMFQFASQYEQGIFAKNTLSLTNIKTSGYFESHMEKVKPCNMYQFSYDKADWNIKKYTYEKYNKSLPYIRPQSKRAEFNEFPDYMNKSNKKFTKEVLNTNYFINDKLMDIFVESFYVSSKVYGYLNRWAGDIIGIFNPSESQSNFSMNNYVGYWLSYKVVHTFTLDFYSNDLFMSQIDRPSNILRDIKYE